MRNHHEKARDMARSVLPSTRRRGARQDRALAHARERSCLRARLHDLASFADPDDYEGNLTWEARREISSMVEERRAADKVAPLVRWAERTVERDPVLREAAYDERLAYFRRLLPEGLIGRHALVHLHWVLDDEPPWWLRRTLARPPTGPSYHEKVTAIVAAGRHGELNRRMRNSAGKYHLRTIRVPAHRLLDEDHPDPGLLIPATWTKVREPIEIRPLLGAHDIDAFVKDSSSAEVHELWVELARDGLV